MFEFQKGLGQPHFTGAMSAATGLLGNSDLLCPHTLGGGGHPKEKKPWVFESNWHDRRKQREKAVS